MRAVVDSAPPEGSAVGKPIVFVVTDHQAVLTSLVADLARRFGADYQVVPVGSGRAAGPAVADAVRRGDAVALVIVDESMTEVRAVDLLTRVGELVPTAKRILLIERGDWSSAHPVVSAMALGQVDYHLYNPWHPLERILYPAVSEFLAAWDKSQDAPMVPVRIVGTRSAARSHELRDTLTRVGVPFWFYEPDTPTGEELLAEAGVDGSQLPVVVFFHGTVLVDPPFAEVWSALGVRTQVDVDSCDVVVIGAGPAGLAAAVYASSEGLETLVLEPAVPGGQAGTSSLIRNYLGFHRGISGDDLANRAVEQAWLFGTRFVLSQAATSVEARGPDRLVRTSDGRAVRARAVVIATGVSWRRLGVPALEALGGSGVFYGAAGAEARAMQGRDVFVVGAGNSAGQAALHLSKYAASVTMVVRGDTVRKIMSEYLVAEIEQAPNIRLRAGTEVVDGGGSGRLETLTLQTRGSADPEVVPAAALFLLIGAEPRTGWLAGHLARDAGGYLLTGRDVPSAADGEPSWPLSRPPMLLETSQPGVFAAGDVRHRSIKRVAAAVGEGATAIQLVHEYLAESDSTVL
jgi:thioredoxin reductase (NADPH)